MIVNRVSGGSDNAGNLQNVICPIPAEYENEGVQDEENLASSGEQGDGEQYGEKYGEAETGEARADDGETGIADDLTARTEGDDMAPVNNGIVLGTKSPNILSDHAARNRQIQMTQEPSPLDPMSVEHPSPEAPPQLGGAPNILADHQRKFFAQQQQQQQMGNEPENFHEQPEDQQYSQDNNYVQQYSTADHQYDGYQNDYPDINQAVDGAETEEQRLRRMGARIDREYSELTKRYHQEQKEVMRAKRKEYFLWRFFKIFIW